MRKLFTSESVTEGHPDKLCDYISDSILDAYLEQDPKSRVGCECVAGKGLVLVTGEITSKAKVDIEKIVRQTIKEIGYTDENTDIDYEKCEVIVNISKQSPDIALGVDNSLESKENGTLEKDIVSEEGAGDQGMVFGFAIDETEDFMPMPIYLSHKLAARLTEVRKTNEIDYLRPDGKVQVTVEYDDGKPVRIDTIVVSTQHKENINLEVLKRDIKEKVINVVIEDLNKKMMQKFKLDANVSSIARKSMIDENTKYYINPTGRFVIGGPLGDTGLTGRKIIVDTYGGFSRHGGGAFSGKDATKVDRSGSYMARYIAKNIVAKGFAKKCELQISYAIGVAKPVSVFVDTFGTGRISDEEIVKFIEDTYDLTPRGIINFLGLENPIYKMTTNYGHFGKDYLAWEQIGE